MNNNELMNVITKWSNDRKIMISDDSIVNLAHRLFTELHADVKEPDESIDHGPVCHHVKITDTDMEALEVLTNSRDLDPLAFLVLNRVVNQTEPKD